MAERAALTCRLDARPSFASYAVVYGRATGQVDALSLPMVTIHGAGDVGEAWVRYARLAFSRLAIASPLSYEAHATMPASALHIRVGHYGQCRCERDLVPVQPRRSGPLRSGQSFGSCAGEQGPFARCGSTHYHGHSRATGELTTPFLRLIESRPSDMATWRQTGCGLAQLHWGTFMAKRLTNDARTRNVGRLFSIG